MGVLSCSRNACNSIMCDTYVSGIGYVCNECQLEFKDYLSSKDIKAETEGDIYRVLKEFMKTQKGYYTQGNEMSVDEFFKSYTPD